ncbi:hypothetical protein [Cupriavidus sp. TMH.W2]|uniref:hypothetical protein n=1 Tax=Cupriavidus sp. TMH.W2 TaxID=3434465 RepID=UPI003D7739B2
MHHDATTPPAAVPALRALPAQMARTETDAQAREILAQDPRYVISMDMDFHCWIREGVPNHDGVPVARGRIIAPLCPEVFQRLGAEMEQAYCSEFYQRRALSARHAVPGHPTEAAR